MISPFLTSLLTIRLWHALTTITHMMNRPSLIILTNQYWPLSTMWIVDLINHEDSSTIYLHIINWSTILLDCDWILSARIPRGSTSLASSFLSRRNHEWQKAKRKIRDGLARNTPPPWLQYQRSYVPLKPQLLPRCAFNSSGALSGWTSDGAPRQEQPRPIPKSMAWSSSSFGPGDHGSNRKPLP